MLLCLWAAYITRLSMEKGLHLVCFNIILIYSSINQYALLLTVSQVKGSGFGPPPDLIHHLIHHPSMVVRAPPPPSTPPCWSEPLLHPSIVFRAPPPPSTPPTPMVDQSPCPIPPWWIRAPSFTLHPSMVDQSPSATLHPSMVDQSPCPTPAPPHHQVPLLHGGARSALQRACWPAGPPAGHGPAACGVCAPGSGPCTGPSGGTGTPRPGSPEGPPGASSSPAPRPPSGEERHVYHPRVCAPQDQPWFVHNQRASRRRCGPKHQSRSWCCSKHQHCVVRRWFIYVSM